ncbi:hypothetical protein ACHAW5_005269 [Stephanodiscus triporus]|uniref:Uncharacterized protein n=1 Tax=Stephanodiscus triporus TaxID=2934178 RepID=A0ABD3PBG5_9STRA
MLSEGRREIVAIEQRLAAANARASDAKETLDSAQQTLESALQMLEMAKKNVESARERVDSFNEEVKAADEEVKAAEAQLKEAGERWQVIEVEDDSDDELSAAAAPSSKRRKVSASTSGDVRQNDAPTPATATACGSISATGGIGGASGASNAASTTHASIGNGLPDVGAQVAALVTKTSSSHAIINQKQNDAPAAATAGRSISATGVVMETKKKKLSKKHKAAVQVAAPPPPVYPIPEMEAKPSSSSRISGGKSELSELLAAGVAPSVVPNDTLLVGTLAYSDRDNLRGHVIRGNWKFESGSSRALAAPPERFELIRFIPPEEDLKELPKDGEFNGSFNVQFPVKNSKGKIKLKTRAVPESGVKLTFRPREDGSEGIFEVHGTGLNVFGTFELYGTATKNSSIVEEDPAYKVSVHKRYVVVAPAQTPAQSAVATAIAGEAESNDKKQNGEDEARPPPTVLPTEEEKKEKERFLMFTRVLMKYLGQRDVNMFAAAKAQIKECYDKNKSGDPQFRSLTASMKVRLRATVGEIYWKKAQDYLDHFLKKKKRGKSTEESSSRSRRISSKSQ